MEVSATTPFSLWERRDDMGQSCRFSREYAALRISLARALSGMILTPSLRQLQEASPGT